MSECAILKNSKNQSFKLVHSIYVAYMSRFFVAAISCTHVRSNGIYSRVVPSSVAHMWLRWRSSGLVTFWLWGRIPPKSRIFFLFFSMSNLSFV